jgi:general secretion pathway protein J
MKACGSKFTGFTLLEMVVAIGIFAVIAAVVYPAIQQFLNARERLNDKSTVLTSLQNTMLFLENDLRYVLDRQVRDGYGDPEVAFSTDIESDEIIRLTTAYPDIGVYGSSVPKRVAWIYDDTDLLRRTWGVLDRVTDTSESTRLMLENVTDLDIRFATVDGNGLDWSKDLEVGQSLPLAIEISFELEDSLTFRRVIELPGGVPSADADDG